MIGVVYRQRKGRNPQRESAFSHPVSFSGHREKPDNNTISSISNTPRHNRRCFSQFDRKTDCFDGGFSEACGVNSVRSSVPENPCWEVRRNRATFKAVCLTQTRHDGPVNKNQPDSQSFVGGIRTIDGSARSPAPLKSNRIALRELIAPDTTNLFWQKPGIVLADVKSSRSQRYNGFRPDRTALRKTSRGWLPSDIRHKDHAGFVLMDIRNVRASF